MVLQDSWTSHFEPLWFDPNEKKNDKVDVLDLFWSLIAASDRGLSEDEILDEFGDALTEDVFDVSFGAGDFKTTPLHEAIKLEKIQTVKLILRFCRDLDSIDGDGLTPLMLAVKFNLVQVTAMLLEKGGARLIARRRDQEGRTPLHLAAARNTTDMLSLLLSYDASLINEPVKPPRRSITKESSRDASSTPLTMALKGGDAHMRCLRMLAEEESCQLTGDENSIIRQILLDREIAAKKDKIELLLDAIWNKHGRKGLHQCLVDVKNPSILNALTTTTTLSGRERSELMRKFLLLGCDPAKLGEAATFTTAISTGDTDCIDLLLAAGCDCHLDSNDKNKNNSTVQQNKSVVSAILNWPEHHQELPDGVREVITKRRGRVQSLKYWARMSWVRGDESIARKDARSAREGLEIPRELVEYLGMADLASED